MIALAKLHMMLLQLLFWGLQQLVRAGLWLIKQPVKALFTFLKLCLAYLNYEAKRWLGLIMAGLMALAIAGILIDASPAGSNWRIVALLICLLFLAALFKTAELTVHNRLWRVRQTQAFREVDHGVKEIRGQVQNLRGEVVKGAAKTAKGTPAESVFRTNREAKAREQEREQMNAERAEARRVEERETAEQERLDREERERYLDELTATQHDPFQGR